MLLSTYFVPMCASQWDTQEDKTSVVPKVMTVADKYYSDTCLFSLYVWHVSGHNRYFYNRISQNRWSPLYQTPIVAHLVFSPCFHYCKQWSSLKTFIIIRLDIHFSFFWCTFLDSLAAKVWRPICLYPLDAHVWGSKITADGDCSHEIKRCFLLGRKAMTNLDAY